MLTQLALCVAAVAGGSVHVHDHAHDQDHETCKSWMLQRMARHMADGGDMPAPARPLPDDADTDVLHYELDIEIVPSSEWLGGTNTMTVESLVDGLTSFTFTLRDTFTINALEVGGAPVGWTRLDEMFVEADLDRPYALGEEFTLFIDYDGYPQSQGFGSIEFDTEGGYPLVFTLSEPWYAHTWWPVKESNTDKATADLKITVPNELTVAANGLLVAVDDVGGGNLRYHWRTEYQTATYLFTFSAAKYNTFGGTFDYDGGSMPLDFFIFPGHDTTANREKWLLSEDMLATLSDLYGLYPFVNEKYGIYDFGFGGGMEHQTMTGQGGFGEALTVHELSHQWWGDMVTCATWMDIWLNEGSAEYSEALWYEHKSGTPDEDALHEAMDDRRPYTVDGSVYVPPDEIYDLWRLFSTSLTYRKGAWVLHQLRHVVGTETYFDILAAYREAYQYSSATTEDLRMVAESVYGGDLTWFFDEWVYDIGAPEYRYAWQDHEIAGQSYVELYVQQVQSVSYPIFIMPLDVHVTGFEGTEIEVIWNDVEAEHFLFPSQPGVVGVELDPLDWTLHLSNQTTGFVQGPPKVVVTSPAPGASVESSGQFAVEVTFHKDVAADAGDFSIVGDAAGPIGFTFVYDAGLHRVTLTPDEAPPADDYTLMIDDGIVDLAAGLALDGELADPFDPASLPSGEGLPGGDAEIRFTLTGGIYGDVTGDGQVDVLDLLAVLAAWGPCPGCVEDITGDGVVDVLDLLQVLANWT